MEIDTVDVARVTTGRRFGFEASTCDLLRVRTTDGTVGIGEIPDIEDVDAAPKPHAVETALADLLVGRDPSRLAHLASIVREELGFDADTRPSYRRLAHCGVDVALYDVVGRAFGIPAHCLLGGKTRDVPVSWVIYTRHTDDELATLETEVEEKVAEGFDAFKFKVGELDVERDVERIRTVREAAGEDATILLDAQALYTTDEAIEALRRFEPLGIDGVETPVGRPDFDGEPLTYYGGRPVLLEDLTRVRDATGTPIIEHVRDAEVALRLVEERAVDVVNVSVAGAGGITRAGELLTIVGAGGLGARLGSTVELGPGTAAGIALASSATAITQPCDLIGPALYERTVVEPPIEYSAGTLAPRDAPGFGLTVPDEVFA